MSTVYRITLVQLKSDAAGVGSASDKIDHGSHPAEEVVRLADKLLQLDLSDTRAEPGIIVQRGDKGWRVAVHQSRLRMHKSMSLFDDFWTADSAIALLDLPPFQTTSAATPSRTPTNTGASKTHGTFRTIAEAAGLFVAALLLVVIGLRFGLPQRRLSDLPPGLTIVSGSERAEVFKAVAGVYSTDKKPGSSLVIITPDGQVSLGTIGKDGKPTKPRIQEQARAGRQGGIACVVTSFGIIAGIEPPEAVKVGNFQWKKAPASAMQ